MSKKKQPISTYDLIHISWHDTAMHGTGQVTAEEAKDYGLMHGQVAGWLVDETDDHVTIAMDFFPAQSNNEKDTFRTLQSYPKSGIENTETLKTLEVFLNE